MADQTDASAAVRGPRCICPDTWDVHEGGHSIGCPAGAAVAELLECCRDATGTERRHLRVMGAGQPLCGTLARQDGAGAGRFSDLLRWPTCAKCRAKAEQLGPHPLQADGAPVRLQLGPVNRVSRPEY